MLLGILGVGGISVTLMNLMICNGKIPWVKESSLPVEVRNMGCKNVVKAIEMVQFGRKFREK